LNHFSKYGAANSSQLLQVINQKAHQSHVIHHKMDITAVMYPWIHHKGYPLIRCLKLPNGRLYLSQVSHVTLPLPLKNFIQIKFKSETVPRRQVDGHQRDGLQGPKVPVIYSPLVGAAATNCSQRRRFHRQRTHHVAVTAQTLRRGGPPGRRWPVVRNEILIEI
jgi:hypothetical protein